MPRNVTEFGCLLISPGDVEAEREELADTVNRWNAQIGSTLGARIDLVRWETHSVPDMSGEPQAVLNEQIVDDCDMGLALFWSRLGTPTSAHASGSVEEINRLLERGVRVLVYFKSAPIPQDKLNPAEYERLQSAKQDFMAKGILGTFDTVDQLKQHVLLHLTNTVAARLAQAQESGPRVLTTGSDVLPKPNVRVRVQPALTSDALGGVVDIVGIHVENHSQVPVYLGNITIQTSDDRLLFIPRDSVTGQFQTRRTLNPGQAFTFNILLDELLRSDVHVSKLERVLVVDDIGRTYESDPEEFRKVIESLVESRANHSRGDV